MSPGRLDEIESRLALVERLKKKYGASVEEVLAFGARCRERARRQRVARGAGAAARGAPGAGGRGVPRAGEGALEAPARGGPRPRAPGAGRARRAGDGEDALRGALHAGRPRGRPRPLGLDRSRAWSAPSSCCRRTRARSCGRWRASPRAGSCRASCSRSSRSCAPTRPASRSSSTRSTRASAGAWPRWSGASCRPSPSKQQVLCVTHLPQIASFADQHLAVRKQVTRGRTADRGRRRCRRATASRRSRVCSGARRSRRPPVSTPARCSSRAFASESHLMEMKAKKRFFIQTFGCQMNVNDSEKVAGLLEARGYEAAEAAHDADFVFLNTCAVREKASVKFRQSLVRLGRMKKGRPELQIGVGGCVAQLEGPAVARAARRRWTSGGHAHPAPHPGAAGRRRRESGRVAIDLDRGADAFDVPDAVTAHANPVRAYVTAMEGCNLVCSFCVVPRTRGPEVNRPPDDIVAEVEAVVARGFPEVMLLGQTVNAYRSSGHDFADLLARVDAVAGLHRLRFTTSHPSHVTPRMARRLPRPEARVPLPAPAGAVGLGPRARSRCAAATRARSISRRSRCSGTACPDIALSTDVIVGYPGETEAEFEETLSLLEAVGFDGLFSFSYSPRPGTTALRARGRRARGREEAPPARAERTPAAVAAAPQRGAGGHPRRGPGRDARRQRPRLRPHAAFPHRAPRRARLACWARRCASRSPRRAPTRFKARLSQLTH